MVTMIRLHLCLMRGKCFSIFQKPGFGLCPMAGMCHLQCQAMVKILHAGLWNFCRGNGEDQAGLSFVVYSVPFFKSIKNIKNLEPLSADRQAAGMVKLSPGSYRG